MSVFVLHQQMLPAAELITAMTGSSELIGEFIQVPLKIIFDNMSDDDVVIYLDVGGGPIQWKTFTAGEALVLDDDLYTFPKGTRIFGDGPGSGNFSVSYTYIKYP